MLTNKLRGKCTVQEKTATLGATGQSVSWDTAGTYWCRKIALDAQARAAYMQLKSVVTHKFLFRGVVILALGQHRIVHDSSTYELVAPPQYIEGNTTVVTRKL